MIGWLIEQRGLQPMWLKQIGRMCAWTEYASEAIRFARPQDAQAVLDGLHWLEVLGLQNTFVSCHEWTDRP